jgi:hypothetical protein
MPEFQIIYNGPHGGFTVLRNGNYIASGDTIEEALENAYYASGQEKLVFELKPW